MNRLRPRRVIASFALIGLLALGALACNEDNPDHETVTVYSGRNQELIGPILERFTEETGIPVEVRYGGTAEMAATILEEGERGRWDIFIAQDGGALGAVQNSGLFAQLDDELLDRVSDGFRSDEGVWVGLSGRARVVAYNTDRIEPEADLPDSILDFTAPEWRGRIGWAPTNGSFQAWVTALRVTLGEDAAREWLEGVRANQPVEYPNNTSIVEAVAAGEVDVGFVNHYYLFNFLRERGDGFAARNHYTAPGDVGTLINVAGAGIYRDSDAADEATELLRYLLSEEGQTYFAEETFEYPVVAGVPSHADLASLDELEPVDLDLSRLEDIEGTLALLRETGVLP